MNLDHKIKDLSAIDGSKFLSYLFLDYLIIFAAIWLHQSFYNPLIYLFTIIIIATRQHAIGILSHDVVHYRFLNNRKVSDWLGNIFITWPLFFTVPGYRSMHLRHHSKLNTEFDPDWVRRKGKSDWMYPMTRKKLYMMLFFDLTGINFYQNIQKLFLPKSDKTLKKDFKNVETSYYVFMFCYYILFLSTIVFYNVGFEFFIYWIVPYFTVFKFIKRIRAVAEHFGIPNLPMNEITRTTIVGPVEAFLFAQHNINYHLDHHLYPGVPFYNLKKLHKLLIENGQLQSLGHINNHGYIKGLFSEVTNHCQLNETRV